MPVYERATRVDAPLSTVWDFHSNVDGLVALTPDWMRLRVERVVGPDGEPNPDLMTVGSRIESSVRPFGLGPRQRWTSVIVEREEGDGWARFRDTMEDGPFAHWEHTHTFHAEGDDATLVYDRVEYELPGGELGRALGPLAYVGFEPMFRHRHRETKALLE
ncbi:SRPBCC family protein [Haloarculaceae archaeon H-GB2-1]|nr:SRPBCC family protein [Haloarculaceae archaeon H-GB1-1]MEA5387536.1 SRPBCC family protein [Haloarculaceae archaeon H-GB11]MEA5409018.1 SRPBCC family protein [Haloarculaceae archaeon H-GB2-1]